MGSTSSILGSSAPQEIQAALFEIANEGIAGCSVVAMEGNARGPWLWRATIDGPDGSLYAGGKFIIYIRLTAAYPLEIPIFHLVTPIFHCCTHVGNNVDDAQIGVLHEWWPEDTIAKVLSRFCGLLVKPDPRVALAGLSHIMIQDYELYQNTARDWTRKYATEGRPAEAHETLTMTPSIQTENSHILTRRDTSVVKLLFSFSEDLCHAVLGKWLDLTDLARLDSAFCNRALRPKFLLSAYELGFAYSSEQYMFAATADIIHPGGNPLALADYVNLYAWAQFRGARLDAVILGMGMVRPVMEHLITYGTSVTTLFILNRGLQEDDEEFQHVCAYCPNISKVFRIPNATDTAVDTAIGRIWPRLDTFFVSGATSDVALLSLTEHSRQLKTIYVSDNLHQYTVGDEDERDEPITFFRDLTGKCCSLQSLRLKDSFAKLSILGFQAFVDSCPLLTELTLYEADGGNFTSLAVLATQLTTLRINCVRHWNTFTQDRNTAFHSLLARCCQLRVLALVGLAPSSELPEALVGQCCPLLEDLTLQGLPHITDDSMYSVATGCRHLLRLELTGTTRWPLKITCAGYEGLLIGCSHLTHMTLKHGRFTDEILCTIARCAAQITHVAIEPVLMSRGWRGLRMLGLHCAALRVVNIPMEHSHAIPWLFRSGVLVNNEVVPRLIDMLRGGPEGNN